MIGLGLVAGLFFDMPHAAAAEASPSIELAKKVIKEVAPIVAAKQETDVEQAALTLKAKDYIEKPLLVETEITPEPKPVVRPRTQALSTSATRAVGTKNYFPYGYCTYYVSQKRVITWSGNAGTWLNGARAAGLATGNTPQAGAIMVTSEGGRTGHVAYVEKVEEDLVTISEMNFKGYGVVSSRTISAASKIIRGYIY